MGRMLKGLDLAKQVANHGTPNVCRMLEKAFQEKKLDTHDWSIADLCENLVPNGREYMQMIDPRRKGGGVTLLEAPQAVDTTAFANITGQIIYSAVREAFEDQVLLANELCTTMKTVFLQGEKVPGIGRMGDVAETVSEGNPYPLVGVSEEYVQSPAAEKRGFIVPVTREITIADRTGILMERVSEVGKWLAVNKEKRVLDVALGITNNYKRNGTSTNTYLTSGAYINDQTSNALADWTDLENAELLFDAITDPNTGEPIMMVADTIIVPTALKRTAYRILNATSIRFNDGASGTTAAYGANPLSNSAGRMNSKPAGEITVLSSAYIKARTSSATKWFYGNPKKAFKYSEVWGIETMQAASNSEVEFTNDILMRYKVSEYGVPWVYEPRYMTRNAP